MHSMHISEDLCVRDAKDYKHNCEKGNYCACKPPSSVFPMYTKVVRSSDHPS